MRSLSPNAEEDLTRAVTRVLCTPDIHVRAGRILDVYPPLGRTEAHSVERAVHKRKREFAMGRHLARSLLSDLGRVCPDLSRGSDGCPAWPSGTWGSITHTDEMALVGVSKRVDGFGLDLEGAEPLREPMFRHILRPDELQSLPSNLVHQLAKVIFSAKEAFYKAQYRHTRTFLGFFDVQLKLQLDSQTFSYEPHCRALDTLQRATFAGGWMLSPPFVVTAAVFTAETS